MFLYKPTPRDDSLVITTLLELAERYPRYGFTKYFAVLRREGYAWNHKRASTEFIGSCIGNTMKDWDTLNLFLYGPPHS